MNTEAIQKSSHTLWESASQSGKSQETTDFAALARETQKRYNDNKTSAAKAQAQTYTSGAGFTPGVKCQSAQVMYTNYVQRNLNYRKENQKIIDEQIAYLKEKYDVENMTQEDLHKLLEELKNMNLISESDIKNQLGHPAPPVKFIITSGDQLEMLLSKSQDEKNYLKRLEMDQKQFQYMMDAFDSGNYAVDQDTDVNELRKFYETQIEQNQKIQDIISQLRH